MNAIKMIRMNKNRVICIFAAILMALSLMPLPAHAVSIDKHEIEFDRIVNARDLGGYKTEDGRRVKNGLLIRSAELSYASDADIKKLRKTYKLGTVIDFRYSSDRKYCPDRKISKAENIGIPAKSGHQSASIPRGRFKKLKKKSDAALRSASIRASYKVGRSYTKSLVTSKYSQRMYKKYFKRLLANKDGRGVLFHCKYGKDRTGVAAFMTLVALGVSEKTAYKEYALTNKYIKKYAYKDYRNGRVGVRTSDLKYSVNLMKKKYGSMENFLKKAYGLDDAKIKKLREMYTE